MDTNNYLIIVCAEYMNSSGQTIKTCSVDVVNGIKNVAIDRAKKKRIEIESDLDRLFSGHDVDIHVDRIGGKEIIDVNHDILFTDKDGRQAVGIFIRTENDVCDFIISKVESSPEHVLSFEGKDILSTPMYEDDDENEVKYKPLNIVKRFSETDDEYIYDVEMLMFSNNEQSGESRIYVDNLNCIGFRTLANIYTTLQNN